jgi:hypothetical protein
MAEVHITGGEAGDRGHGQGDDLFAVERGEDGHVEAPIIVMGGLAVVDVQESYPVALIWAS